MTGLRGKITRRNRLNPISCIRNQFSSQNRSPKGDFIIGSDRAYFTSETGASAGGSEGSTIIRF